LRFFFQKWCEREGPRMVAAPKKMCFKIRSLLEFTTQMPQTDWNKS